MNKYLKSFLQRGLIFGGFGPVITGIIYYILSITIDNFSVSGTEMFTAIISTYLLAFVHAGCSIFNQVEHWPIAKSLFFHFLSLYLAYSVCYLINSWIPFDITVFLIFTGIFVLGYAIVWLIVYLIVKQTERKLNSKLNK
ncbi:MAG: DUF3021 domain-containing protein [Clostridia bacterium]|nr:DUF3021 domain-containing protein [Clostridia bacterium]